MARRHDLAEIERAMDTLEATKSLVGAKAVRPALAVLRKREREAWKQEWSRMSAAGEKAAVDLWHAVVTSLAAEKVRRAGKAGRKLSRHEAQMAAATAVTDAMGRCVEGETAVQMSFLRDLRSASDAAGDLNGPEVDRSDAVKPDGGGDDGGTG